MRILKGFDWFLFLPMLLLIIFGITVLFSTYPTAANEQIVFALVRFVLFVLLSLTDFRILKPLSPYIYFLNLILLVLTLLVGLYSKGAVRWIPLGIEGFTLQPSEFMKLSLIIALSSYLSSRFWGNNFKSFLFSVLIFALPAVLIFLQPDLGTAITTFVIWVCLVFSSQLSKKYLFIFLSLLLIISPLIFFSLKPYQRQRLLVFVAPSLDPLGAGYHVMQSELSIGSGQLWGRGYGRGTQSHLRFLPEYHTDFIFAALSEEWGFTGAFAVIIFYSLIFLRLIRVFVSSNSFFGQLLVLGVFYQLFSQVVVNIGMNLGMAPVTGIPLPFLSSGGSSLVLSMIFLGLVQSVARYNKRL